MEFTRYAIFFTPPPGSFATAGAIWLGWDIAAGKPVQSPHPDLVKRPQKYGFHATLKAPFTLADGATQRGLEAAIDTLVQDQPRVTLTGLEVTALGRFAALTVMGDTAALGTLAARCVTGLDGFRAPLTALERRRKTRPNMAADLTANLDRWGYPHVLDAFRFHMTLSRPLQADERQSVLAAAHAHFAPYLSVPFVIGAVTLVGEGTDGLFREIKRFELQGAADA